MKKIFEILNKLSSIGDKESDSPREKLKHKFLIFMTIFMSLGGVLWGSIALSFNLFYPSMIPLGYTLLSVINLFFFYQSKNFIRTRIFQITISLLLPFLFQWSLGGFIASGAVMLWATLAIVGSLTFGDSKSSILWLLVYIVLTVISGIFDNFFVNYKLQISENINILFFVINISIVSTIVFGLTIYLQNEQEKSYELVKETDSFLKGVMGSTQEGIMVFKAIREANNIIDFEWIFTNKSGENLVQQTHEKLVGKRLLKLMPLNHEIGLFQKYVDVVNTSNSLNIDQQISIGKFDGWLQITAVKFRDGIIVTFSDISNRKMAEKQLIDAREQAEAGNRAKSDFLATMSHEIRTPLNGIIGFTDLLMKTTLNDSQKQYMGIVYKSALSLLDLLSDILDFSKIEAGKLEINIEKMDIFELASQTTEIIKYKADEKQIKVKLNISSRMPRFIFTDSIRLRQILINLLGNSVKFTSKGEIELKIDLVDSISKDKRKKILFSVRDTGIGVSKENQKKIFEAFSQEDSSTTRRYGGTGLGLTISNKLLSLMNSKMELESESQKGSCFYFILETETEEESLNEFRLIEKNNINNNNHKEKIQLKHIEGIYQILIVDDNEVNSHLAGTLLKQILPNSKILKAKNGKLAIESFKEKIPDLIFMDIQMPEMNGYEATKEIRKLEKSSRVPIIALTAGTVKEEIETCFLAGMDDYASKPIIKNDLEKIILKWLNIKA